MKSAISFLCLLLCLATLPACRTAKIAADVAQAAFEPYSVEAVGRFGDSAGAPGGIHANSRFIAIDAGAEGAVRIWGPVSYGGPVDLLKTFEFASATGRRVWAIQFQADRSKPVALVPATWEQARISMPHLAP